MTEKTRARPPPAALRATPPGRLNCGTFKDCGRVAQLVEQCPFKAWVAGSNPAALTIHFSGTSADSGTPHSEAVGPHVARLWGLALSTRPHHGPTEAPYRRSAASTRERVWRGTVRGAHASGPERHTPGRDRPRRGEADKISRAPRIFAARSPKCSARACQSRRIVRHARTRKKGSHLEEQQAAKYSNSCSATRRRPAGLRWPPSVVHSGAR